MQNKIMEILNFALDNPYEYGTNDCNLMALRIIDAYIGTEFSNVEYSTIKEGLTKYKELGWQCPAEIVKEYCYPVEHTIDGDIWIDPENPLIMAVVAAGRVLGIDDQHSNFELHSKPKNGTYYRVRISNG